MILGHDQYERELLDGERLAFDAIQHAAHSDGMTADQYVAALLDTESIISESAAHSHYADTIDLTEIDAALEAMLSPDDTESALK